MKINVIAVGKIKEKYFVEAVNEYSKRLSRFADIKIIEVDEAPPKKSREEIKRLESDEALKRARGLIVVADLRGEELSSEKFAAYIDGAMTAGKGEISFLIGGSYGFDDDVLKRADLVLSFGKATFAHQLFRVMLLEQIYRAFSINAGMPYHK